MCSTLIEPNKPRSIGENMEIGEGVGLQTDFMSRHLIHTQILYQQY